jgi:hypothetical protein
MDTTVTVTTTIACGCPIGVRRAGARRRRRRVALSASLTQKAWPLVQFAALLTSFAFYIHISIATLQICPMDVEFIY